VIKKELLNSNVLFRSEVEAATKIPIAAEIADSQMKNYVVIDNLKKPYLTEQFAQLRAAAGLTNGGVKKVVMITSSIAGEGKSFITTNFAISLAGSSKRVLVIDMDLRNPRLSSLYRVGNATGLAEFLLGEVTIEKIIRRTRTQNLFLIGAGIKRSKATEMILDGNIAQLFASLRTLFDYIIVDTPPVAPVIDGAIISPYCDTTLFVVRHGKTPKRILESLDENQKVVAMKNVSIVFNGIAPRGFVKNDFGYGYGEAYEYPYTDRSQKSKKAVW
jgi:capsular exopolysaccharide synthesis family protein